MSYSGVLVSAWVKIERECEMQYTVCGDTVELCMGGYNNGFQFDATEGGLERLIETSTDALRALRSGGE